MRALALLGLMAAVLAASDLARQYPPASAPGLISGTAASYAAGAGVPEIAGKERASQNNQHAGHDYRDDRTR